MEKREMLYEKITNEAIAWSTGIVMQDEIDEINQKKEDLDNVKKNIIASSKTLDDLNGKIQLEESEFKEIIWRDIYKTNEAQFKNAFVGFLKKDSFTEKRRSSDIIWKHSIFCTKRCL